MAEHRTLIRLPIVLAVTGYGRSSIYQLTAQGKFPLPVKLGARATAWVADEVDAWVAERIAARTPVSTL